MTSWVAEVFVPAFLYGPERPRYELPTHPLMQRGYFRTSFTRDRSGTQVAEGLNMVLEFKADHLEGAEDAALSVANELAELVALFAGSPLMPARIRRVARVGNKGGILEQHEYYYDADHEPPVQIEANFPYLEGLLTRVSTLTDNRRERVRLAVRWFGISVAASAAADAFLALWIGMEAIGPVVNDQFHPAGTTAPCEVCKNALGVKRNRTFAGMEHAMKKISPELLDNRSFADLKDLRDDLAHGLSSISTALEEARRVVLEMQLVLATSCLTALNGPPGLFRATLPRDYEERPDARASIFSDHELLDHHPYLGSWIVANRQPQDFQSRFEEATGHYSWGEGMGVSWTLKTRDPLRLPTQNYVRFRRAGRDFTPGDTTLSGDAAQMVEQADWRPRVVPPSWERATSLLNSIT